MKTFIKNINKLSNKLREVCDFEENHKLVISHIEDRMELFEETPDCEELKELRAENIGVCKCRKRSKIHQEYKVKYGSKRSCIKQIA